MSEQQTKRIEEDIFEWEEWEDWDQVDVLAFQFYSVRFKRAFGPWTEGQECSCVALLLDQSKMVSYDDDGTVTGECAVKLVTV